MINLLPDEIKSEVRAARTNVKLLNYMLILGMGVVFLCFIFVGVYLVLVSSKVNAEQAIADNQQKTNSYSAVQQQASILKSSLLTAKTVLDKEIIYSKIITGIAADMPAGTVIDSLNLTVATLGSPISLQAYAKTTDDALKLKQNFQRSSLFSNVSFQSLANSSSTKANGYPVSITLTLTINKDAIR